MSTRRNKYDRLLYLVHGYIRSIRKCMKNTIPNEIKSLCKEFANFKVKSHTDIDIEIEKARRKDPVWYRKIYFFIMYIHRKQNIIYTCMKLRCLELVQSVNHQ